MQKLDFTFCLIVSHFVCNHSHGAGVWKISKFNIADSSTNTTCTEKFRIFLNESNLNSSEWPNFSNIPCPHELRPTPLIFTILMVNDRSFKLEKLKESRWCIFFGYIQCSKKPEPMKTMPCSFQESSECRRSIKVTYTVEYYSSSDTSFETRYASSGIIDVTNPPIESATQHVVKTYTENSLMSGNINETGSHLSSNGYETENTSSVLTDETNPSVESVTRFVLNKTHTENSSTIDADKTRCLNLWIVISIETTVIAFGLVAYMISYMPRGKLHGIFTRKSPCYAEIIPTDPDARYPRNGQKVPLRSNESKMSTLEVNDIKMSPPLDIESNVAVPVADLSKLPYIRRSALLSDTGHQDCLMLSGTQHSSKDSQQIQETQKSRNRTISNRTTSNISKTVTAGKNSSAIKSIGFLFEKAKNYQSSTIQQITSTNLPQTLSETVKTGTANQMNSRAEKTTESQPVPIEELPINILKRIWRVKIREKD